MWLALLLACASPAPSPSSPPDAVHAPEEYDASAQIMARHAAEGSDPAVVLHLWLEAIFLMQSSEAHERAAGEAALVALSLPLREDPQWRHYHSHVLLLDRIQNQGYIFHSYVKGTTPEGGYAFNPRDFEIEITRRDEAAEGAPLRLFLRSSGADSPRPVGLKRSTTTGRYYLWEWSSLYVGVRKPHKPGEERFE
jgi:hypothetical protein